jgi:cobalamin biosynthesis Mg chelatase CobN
MSTTTITIDSAGSGVFVTFFDYAQIVGFGGQNSSGTEGVVGQFSCTAGVLYKWIVSTNNGGTLTITDMSSQSPVSITNLANNSSANSLNSSFWTQVTKVRITTPSGSTSLVCNGASQCNSVSSSTSNGGSNGGSNGSSSSNTSNSSSSLAAAKKKDTVIIIVVAVIVALILLAIVAIFLHKKSSVKSK